MKCLPKVFLFLSSWHCPLTQKQDWKWCCKQFPAGFCGYESRGQSSSSFFLMGNWHIGPLCVGIHNVFSQSSDLAKSKRELFGRRFSAAAPVGKWIHPWREAKEFIWAYLQHWHVGSLRKISSFMEKRGEEWGPEGALRVTNCRSKAVVTLCIAVPMVICIQGWMVFRVQDDANTYPPW